MNFNDFVGKELPKRPFVETDGQPGQAMVRSTNAQAVREMVWTDLVTVENVAPIVGEAVAAEVGTIDFVAAYLLSL